MSAAFEAFLARLYVDPDLQAAVRADPTAAGQAAGLDASGCAALETLDWVGLELAAESIRHKRVGMTKPVAPGRFRRWWQRLRPGG